MFESDFLTDVAALFPQEAAQTLLERNKAEFATEEDFIAHRESLLQERHTLFETVQRMKKLLSEKNYDGLVRASNECLRGLRHSSEAYDIAAAVYELTRDWKSALSMSHFANFLSQQSGRRSSRQIHIEDCYLRDIIASLPAHMKIVFYNHSGAGGEREPAFREKAISPESTPIDVPKSSSVSRSWLPKLHDMYRDLASEEQKNGGDADSALSLARLSATSDFEGSKMIKPGDILYKESPYAVAPYLNNDEPQLFQACFHCLREYKVPHQAIRCPRFPQTCPFVFCSPECVIQRAHLHYNECPLISSVLFPLAKQTGYTAGFVLLVIRVLAKGYLEKTLQNSADQPFQKLFNLNSYRDVFETHRPWIWRNCQALRSRLCDLFPPAFLQYMRHDELDQCIAILHSNTLPIASEGEMLSASHREPTLAVGYAICSEICTLRHSCVANCTYEYSSEGQLILRARRDINLASEALTLSFLPDIYRPVCERKHLETSFKILECQCKRCLDPHDSHLRSQFCTHCRTGFTFPLASPYISELATRASLNGQAKSSLISARSEPPLLDEPQKSPRENHHDISASAPRQLQSTWACETCGVLDIHRKLECEALESKMASLVTQARAAFAANRPGQAVKLLTTAVDQFATSLHPNHHLVYTAHVFLGGLMHFNQNATSSVRYLKRAIVALHQLDDGFLLEKVHLYHRLLASVQKSQFSRDRRTLSSIHTSPDRPASGSPGLQDPQQFELELAWNAVVTAGVLRGKGSSCWIAALERLRLVYRAIDFHTPPNLFEANSTKLVQLLWMTRDLSLASTSHEAMRTKLLRDPYYLLFISCAKGDTETLKLLISCDNEDADFFEAFDAPSGLTALGLAAYYSQAEAVKLLSEGRICNVFARNEYDMTPLLAMASRSPQSGSEEDRRQAAICKWLVQYATWLQSQFELQYLTVLPPATGEVVANWTPIPELKTKLLSARTHRLWGHNSVLHYAAFHDKVHLLRECLCHDLDPDLRNGEGATPLHFAVLNDSLRCLRTLIEFGASVQSVSDEKISPLMLAAYYLRYHSFASLVQAASPETIQSVFADAPSPTLSCAHCLILGLFRLTQGLEGSLATRFLNTPQGMTLLGSNQELWNACKHTQPLLLGPHHRAPSERVAVDQRLLLNPEHLTNRLVEGRRILRLICEVAPKEYLRIRMPGSGMTAAELLQYKLDELQTLLNAFWSGSNLRLAGMPTSQRENWTRVRDQFFVQAAELGQYMGV